VREVTSSTVSLENGFVLYRIEASGFVKGMVRSIVGTLVGIGGGKMEPASLASILEAKNREAAGPSAPARGLFLVRVSY